MKPTNCQDHEKPDVKSHYPEGGISLGDGYVQVQTKESLVKNIKIKPNIENLGDGLFTIKTPDSSESKGEWFELEK